MMGRVVKTLVNDQQTTGYKSTQYNPTNDYGKSMSAGIYFYQIKAGDFL
jgi:flagellar hook assembly protein FlgD